MMSNSFFFQGKTHDICQDYTLTGPNFAVVCDGCSSSIHTDIGARLIAHTVANNIHLINDPNFGYIVASKAKTITNVAGFNPYCLDSTIVAASKNSDNVNISVIGDGLVAIIYNDEVVTYDVAFPSGAPCYANYYNDQYRFELYKKQFGNRKIISKNIYKDNIWYNEFSTEISEDIDFGLILPAQDIKAVVCMSDGVHSFRNGTQHIPVDAVLTQLLSFKGLDGEFIKRRVKRFIKDMAALNWENIDDVSLAGISLEETCGV